MHSELLLHQIKRVLLLLALFCSSQTAFAGDGSAIRKLDVVAKQLADNQSLPEFRSVVQFANQKAWDSVIVYTAKTLALSKNKQVRIYTHFYRGWAFRCKELFKQAQKEFRCVPRDFEFYFKLQVIEGEIFLKQSKFQSALQHLLVIDTLNPKHRLNISLDVVQHNIGLCYMFLDDYKKAEYYMLTSIRNCENTKDYEGLIASYMDLASIYYEQYLDPQAIVYFEKAYLLSKKHGSFQMKMNAAFNMAVMEENRKRYEPALKYRVEFEMWQDSVNDQNKVYDVAQLEKKFAVEQKQRQVKLLETKNKLKQSELNMYLFAAIALLAILVFGFYLYRQNVKRSKIILKQKQELDVLNATKDQLFSIVSHDLRSSVNALRNSNNSLKNQLVAKEYDQAETQLEQNSFIAANAYNMLDNLLNWALLQTKGGYFKQEEHRLALLVDHVAFNFKGLLDQKNMTFENNLPKTIKAFVDAESMKIVFRNFMDNSIKFSEEGASISVILSNENDSSFQFEWVDTGKGMSEETRLKLLSNSPQLTKKDHENTIGSGLGMNLCKSMIEKNGGTLNIWSEPNAGTKMIVTLQKAERKNGTH